MTVSNNRALDWTGPDVQPLVLGLMTLLALVWFLGLLWPKFRVLSLAGKENRFENPVARLWNTLTIALAQTKMFKDMKPGWMHAAIFWGFLVFLIRAAQFFVIGFFPETSFEFPGLETLEKLYSLIKDCFVLLVTLAASYALYRRLVFRPQRLTLSGEGILILALILIIMVSDVLFDAAWLSRHPEAAGWWVPLGLMGSAMIAGPDSSFVVHVHNLAYWSHVGCILFFMTLLPRSKHFHIVTSIPNVYFSREGQGGNGLSRIDFENENEETLGVTRIEEFSWKKLLDLHTCTECGRCDVVCPALASGKPLSPKEFTIELRDHLNRETPRLLAGAPKGETDSPPPGLMGRVIQDETVWSCTTCGACEEECPVMIEFVNKMIDLRRGLVMAEDRYPQEFAGAFKSLETNGNPWGFAWNSRDDWAQGLDVKIWDRDNPTEYLYFVGCNGSFDTRGKKITQAVVSSLKEAGVDFSILGNDEKCTGDPARRAGNEYLFDMLAAGNAETFKEKSVRKIITHCPHCFNSMKNEYGKFGVELEVIHHSDILVQLAERGKTAGKRSAEKVVYHDSCYMGRHNGQYDAPRKVIQAKVEAASQLEVEQSRERGTCCGAGGARFLLEEKTGTRMSHNRVDELMKSDPDTIAVSCPFCVLMIEDALKAKNLNNRVKVKDISELGI